MNEKLKRIIVLLLTAVLVAGMLPLPAVASDAGGFVSNVIEPLLQENEEEDFGEPDPLADLETEEDFVASLKDIKLKGLPYNERLIAVAETQLGYSESESNFIVREYENGNKEKVGYTRYGAWYGHGFEYEDWCAMFISFCLHYAEVPVELMPIDSGVITWMHKLQNMELYQGREYLPKSGDLVFFDYDLDGQGDHVGIVNSLFVEDDVEMVETIEGNHTTAVGKFTYPRQSLEIMGYGIMSSELPEDEQENQIFKDFLSEDGSVYRVTMTYTAEAQIPENAEVRVSEILSGTEEYAAYVAETEGALGLEEGSAGDAKVLDICIFANEVEIQPAVSVNVEVVLIDQGAEAWNVVHFSEEEVPEVLENASEGDVVTFETEGFSVFVFTRAVIEKTLDASDGNTYKITVTYDSSAGIPDGATLAAEEILPASEWAENNTDAALLYEEYVTKAEEALGLEAGSASYIRLFDIKILDGNGDKVEISAPVDVKVELADKEENQDIQVVHFADGAETGDVVQNVEYKEAKAEGDGLTLTFAAEGFSVYAIVDAPEPVSIDSVKTLEELAENNETKFYLSYNGNHYFTNVLNSNSAFIETTNINNASVWYFEKVRDDIDNQYYIYTFDDSDNKQYMHNKNGNLMELNPTNKTAFELSQAAEGKFYFKVYGENKWLQHSGSGSGIRLWTDNNNATNSQIIITYAELPHDPYGLNGKTYGIAYHNDSTTSAALTAESANNNTRLAGKDMVMKPDVLDNDGILLVSQNSDIREWTFESIEEDKYYITTTIDGQKKYLTINNAVVTLADTPDEIHSVVRATPGTGTNSGKWHFSVGNYSLNYNNNSFNTATGSGATTWLNLVEKSVLNDDDFTLYSAKKVSASDMTQLNSGARVVVYTRVWNDTTKKYEFYAVDHDGSLVRCYDTGDGVEWIGSDVNTAAWVFTEYFNQDGTPNYYYELQNEQYGNCFAPQLSSTPPQVMKPGSQANPATFGINLNGRRYGESYTTIIAWDNDQYVYTGLKVENGRVVPCTLSEAEDFYFAIVQPVEHHVEAPEPTEVATIDSTQYGITMKMVDFNNPIINGRDSGQTAVFGYDTNVFGLLSSYLGEDGYPFTVTSATGQGSVSLGSLYSGATDVNQLFLESIYNESGYFEYDSTQNFAYLNSDGNFTVYNQIGAITGSGEHKITREHGQFMPYDDISGEKGYAVDSNGHIITNRTNVLANELPDTDPRKDEPLYNIGSESTVNYFFGMELEARFTQTPSGLDAWGHDIIFEFSGDDDFWLYVDGKLVLDVGGVHAASVGTINFRTGNVEMILRDTNGHTSRSKTTTLRSLFEEAYRSEYPGKTDAEVKEYLNDIFKDGGTVFKDYSNHTMQMFYMERGAGSSNLHMRFNLASVKPGTVELSKKLSGTDSTSNSLLEFPYQILYTTTADGGNIWHKLTEKTGESYNVTYKNTVNNVNYRESLTIGSVTYEHVFLLRPGQTAVIDLPDNTLKYKIVECGVNTAAFDHVLANGTELNGESTDNTDRKDYSTNEDDMENRPSVEFDNHVKEGAMKNLSITKVLYDQNGTAMLTYPADSTLFSFRLYLDDANIADNNIALANLYPYYIMDPDGSYCRRQGGVFVPIEGPITEYSALKAYLTTLTPAEKDAIIFYTSPNGSITQIPAGYTVEVPDLLIGSHWKVEERDNEIPRGYTLRLSDGYTRTDTNPDVTTGTTPITGIIDSESAPKVDVRNQKGWGLTVEKIWTDEDFMNHDPIYFAVYYEREGETPELIDGSVQMLVGGNTEIYYFFSQEQMSGRSFADYKVYEVVLTNPRIDQEDGGILYDDISPIPDDGILVIGGTPKGTETHQEGLEYTVTYQPGEQTDQNENVRTDTVTNSRPGIKLIKTDWEEEKLAGAVFTLKDSNGENVALDKYTSREPDGLITIAYLNQGEYTLSEIETPVGYIALDDPIKITVNNDNSISITKTDGTEYDNSYYTLAQTMGNEMATITIKNRPVELKVVKIDADTKAPIQGVKFDLYNQVTDSQGNPIKDHTPIENFSGMTTNEDGNLTEINIEAPGAGTYYLVETKPADNYDSLNGDICFSIGKDGVVSITDATTVTSGQYRLERGQEAETGKVTWTITILNGQMKTVSFIKVDINDVNRALSGATFDLYAVDIVNGRDVRQTPALYIGLTSGSDGVLTYGAEEKTLFELPIGRYHLVETQAPNGYNIKTVTVVVDVTAETDANSVQYLDSSGPNGVIYDEGTSLSSNKTGIMYDNTTKVYTMKISNTPGIELPKTGGVGTAVWTAVGAALSGAAGAILMLRRKKRRT